jgi:hypothetical protein
MSDPRACLWCACSFEPRRGGTPQRFCGVECRTAFWSALRRWGERAVAAGILTIADLQSDSAPACTLPERGKPTLPLSDIERSDTALLDAPLRFLVEVEHSTLAGLVRLGFIYPEQRDDVAAIIASLKRIGRVPRISRIA